MCLIFPHVASLAFFSVSLNVYTKIIIGYDLYAHDIIIQVKDYIAI